ncbi:MAG: FAD-binding domain-containing protein [Cyanobacteria bacterium P01_A01_bin.105]
MSDLILFWHRRDLRTGDNVGLAQAQAHSRKLVGVFCLDPGILKGDDIAPVRVVYLLGCLAALQARYREAGSELLIVQGQPQQALPTLAEALGGAAVYWNRDVEPYAVRRDAVVADALKEKGVKAHGDTWDQLMHAPGEILTGSHAPYSVYTPFWRNWRKQRKLAPVGALEHLTGLTPAEKTQAKQAGAIDLPSAAALGFQWDNPLPVEPGEQAAADLLATFCQDDRAIGEYDQQRNFPSVAGTSMLSAALKFGAIGIRTVWAEAEAAYDRCRSDEGRDNVTTWMQELAWREFYQHVMHFFPSLAEGPYREPLKDFPWDNNEDLFQAWCEGRTGYPIVDAAMRQLNETGWMHNRCRMIVASFLTKDLIINWQWGEKYFMQRLIDGDLSANNGGWQWSASSGMDPKPLRIFNPASQAKKFDAEGEYIRQWVPEIRRVDTGSLLSGEIGPLEREGTGYPEPVVSHKRQQAEFKARYKQQRERAK